MNNLLAILDGSVKHDYGQGALVAIFAIILVFVILALIIGITYLVNIAIKKAESKKPAKKQEEKAAPVAEKKTIDLSDDDAKAAMLVAAIDMRNETKKQVKVISVKEIK